MRRPSVQFSQEHDLLGSRGVTKSSTHGNPRVPQQHEAWTKMMKSGFVWTPWLGGALAAVDDFLASSVGQAFRRWVLPTHHLLTRL